MSEAEMIAAKVPEGTHRTGAGGTVVAHSRAPELQRDPRSQFNHLIRRQAEEVRRRARIAMQGDEQRHVSGPFGTQRLPLRLHGAA